MSRACSGTLSSENDDFKFFKTAKNIKCTCITCTIVPGARETVLSLQTSLSLTRNMNVTVAKELYYIFSKILKFRFGNFSLTLSIFYTTHIRVDLAQHDIVRA